MDVNRLCMGCMNDKGHYDICPYCGWAEQTTPESMYFLPPQTILHGKYLLGRVLGQGGFGITYLAWDLDLGVKLAIKEYLPRDFATRMSGQHTVSAFSGEAQTFFSDGLERFLEEAKTLARLDGHPNIVAVRDFFRENGTAYFVMNYLDGLTLKQYLDSQAMPPSFPTALQLITPVMDALQEIHAQGILHRDISPDNIFITDKGIIKILDFGAARQALNQQSKGLSVILKPGYAPEEQYRSKGRQGPWTDVYAVAATLYRMLCGQTPPEPLDRMSGESLWPPSRKGVAVPPASEAALMKALSLKAEDRFQTIKEFQMALASGAGLPSAKVSAAAQVPAPPQPVPVQVTPPPAAPIVSPQLQSGPMLIPPAIQPALLTGSGNKKTLLIVGLGSLACLCLILLGVFYYQSQPQSNNDKSQTSVAVAAKSQPDAVVSVFYDNLVAKNYQAGPADLGGEMLASYSPESLSQSDIYFASYRIVDSQPVDQNRARVTVEAQLKDSTQESATVKDTFLVEFKDGRWFIVQLMNEELLSSTIKENLATFGTD
ncbi:MAG TPA: serine/threonine-protein kinase [Syntrophomonadaceae bacterium]|nr:serine/threonine-protein kinase [Syntrophomonadaceae bacterium]